MWALGSRWPPATVHIYSWMKWGVVAGFLYCGCFCVHASSASSRWTGNVPVSTWRWHCRSSRYPEGVSISERLCSTCSFQMQLTQSDSVRPCRAEARFGAGKSLVLGYYFIELSSITWVSEHFSVTNFMWKMLDSSLTDVMPAPRSTAIKLISAGPSATHDQHLPRSLRSDCFLASASHL